MQQTTVFIYNKQKEISANRNDIFKSEILKAFDTDNIYQLMRYANEVFPDMLIFEIEDEKSALLISHFLNRENHLYTYPIIAVQKHNHSFPLHKHIAHYFYLPLEQNKLQDTVESYCIGHKTHDIMLLSTYDNNYDKLHHSLDNSRYTYFNVHNLEAAKIYLTRNNPNIICVEYTAEFQTLAHDFPHKRIFYVDRQQDIAEIGKFLH